ncbi:MAG: hypothetical protein WC841_01100 [Candidatus Shapirobacteria bacterium]
MTRKETVIVSVSTDIAGAPGRLDQVREAYSRVDLVKSGIGLEVVGLSRIKWSEYNNLGLKVNGIHGPPGCRAEAASKPPSLRSLFMGAVFDYLIVDPTRLVEISKKFPGAYILVHLPVVNSEKKIADMVGISQGFPANRLMVENLPEANSMGLTIAAVGRLKELGVRAGVMIDLVHLLYELSQSGDIITGKIVEKYWENALQIIRQTASTIDTVGLHVPIGLKQNDSLPVVEMTLKKWTSLGKLLQECPPIKYVTIENQREELQSAFLIDRGMMQTLIERNGKIMSLLREAGVI